jgi:hypothetical protein
MAKTIYNVLSIAMSCALVTFIIHCINQYNLYHMNDSLLYAFMSALSIVVLLTSLSVGGKKK